MTARLLATLLVFMGLSAAAAPPPITLRLVVGGFSSPVEIANAADGSGRLFVVEQAGVIKIVANGAVLATPFLDISARVLCCGERGLLGLAFHPLYRANGKFYVFYTAKANGTLADGTIVVAEYMRSAGNANAANTTERQLLTLAHPAGNHNGGHIAFGPDGYLYIAIGDGGGARDPNNNGQNLNVLLGKLLRIDVNATTYAVPPSNPFVGQSGRRPEIWAYGLRNPWRFSFDRTTGDLVIGDVGEDQWEEVDVEPAGSMGGFNYGWSMFEGSHCFKPPCDPTGKMFPVIEYSHANAGNVIVGGYVYRGLKSRALRGYYIYGDNGSNRMWAASGAEGWAVYQLINGPGSISTYGEDEAGELYVGSLNGGIYAIDAPLSPVPVRGDFNGDGKADILWRNTATGENYLYLMNGKTIAGEGYLRTVPDQNWKVAGIGDFNGDGRADVLWRNSATGENYIYLMNGTVISGEGYVRTVADQNWQVAGVADFDGDGKDDILWRNGATGENYIYLMNGTVISAESYLRTVADQSWLVAGVGDLDGDGKADIVWRNSATGENYAYFMDGLAIKPSEGYLRTVGDLNWRIAGVADFDGDGADDILWRNAATGENYLYPMKGRAIKSTEGYVRTVADTQWQLKGTRDYDGDGKADILWRHAASGENYLYPMDGTTIKPAEGYLRNVAQPDWQIQNPPSATVLGQASEASGTPALMPTNGCVHSGDCNLSVTN
jgi:hypothetical protein